MKATPARPLSYISISWTRAVTKLQAMLQHLHEGDGVRPVVGEGHHGPHLEQEEGDEVDLTTLAQPMSDKSFAQPKRYRVMATSGEF